MPDFRSPRGARAHVRGVVILLGGVLLGGLSSVRAEAAALRILPLGDSITSGMPGHPSYRYALWHRLHDAGYRFDFVGTLSGVSGGLPPVTDFDMDHEGHTGFRSDQLAVMAPRWTQVTRPDIVLLHIGHNDLAQWRTPSLVIQNTGRIIDGIRSVCPDVTILLARLIPSAAGGPFDSIAVVDALIPELAVNRDVPSSPVIVVDQERGFDPRVDTFDLVHPNDVGESVMAENWFEPLAALLDRMPPVAEFHVGAGLHEAGAPFAFDASPSETPSPLRSLGSFLWDFGDGAQGSGRLVSHAYARPGVYAVTLTVVDDLGHSQSMSSPVDVRRHGFPSTWGRLKERWRLPVFPESGSQRAASGS